MRQYIMRRILLALVTILGSTLLVFGILQMIPGNFISSMLAGGEAMVPLTEEQEAELERIYGLDKPPWERYYLFIKGVFTLDTGTSFKTQKPVIQELRRALPVTLELTVMTMILVIIGSFVFGTIAALMQDRWADYLIRVFLLGGLSFPVFWLGIMTLMALVWMFNWIPPVGYRPFFEAPMANLQQFGIPALTVAWRFMAVGARLVRSSMLDVLRQDYIRTAYAKGLRQVTVTSRHAMKNAAIPAVSLLGVQAVALMSGVIVTETVFAMPGIGQLLALSVFDRDIPVVQFLLLVFAIYSVVINLLIDISYGWLDPRIRYA